MEIITRFVPPFSIAESTINDFIIIYFQGIAYRATVEK